MGLHWYQEEAGKRFKDAQKGLLVTLPAGTGKSWILYEEIKKLNGSGPVMICTFLYVIYEHAGNIPNYLPEHRVIMANKKYTEYGVIGNKDIVLITPTMLIKYLAKLLITPFKLLAFDESHMFKNRSSKRTKHALALCYGHKDVKKLLLTATPCPEGIGEVQAQIEMIDPECLLGNYKYFSSNFVKKINMGSYWKTTWIRQEEIKALLKPYVYHVNRDKLPLPEQVTKRIGLEMPDDLKVHYELLRKECTLMIAEFGIEMFITSGIWQKLLQVCAGFIIDTKASVAEEGTVLYDLSSDKAQIVKDMIDNIDCPIIVWGTFRYELIKLHNMIPESQLIMGGVKDGQRIIDDFKAGRFKVLVANPKCIGAGVSLEVAGAQIAPSVDPSCCLYTQTVARTNRINQKRNVVRYEIYYKHTVEERLFSLVSGKDRSQKDLLRQVGGCL